MKEENLALVVVLGMHRSGTSVTARALQVLGVDLGEDLIPAVSGDNDKGFWEDAEISHFDNGLLEKMGNGWDRLALVNEQALSSKYATERKAAALLLKRKLKADKLFGFKDPRALILLPFWKSVFREIGLDDRYVIAVRNPINVARSLFKRNEIPVEMGVLLWSKYMIGVLRYTKGRQCVVVDYDLLLESPNVQIRRIANILSIPFDESCEQQLEQYEKEFLRRSLRHNKVTLNGLETSKVVPEFVKDAYRWMLKLAKDEIYFEDIELQNFWKQFEETFRSFKPCYPYMDQMRISYEQMEQVAGKCRINSDNLARNHEVVKLQLDEKTNELNDSREEMKAFYLTEKSLKNELSELRLKHENSTNELKKLIAETRQLKETQKR